MDVKKYPEVKLENKKGSFFAIGLLFALAMVLAGFEYRTFIPEKTIISDAVTGPEIDVIDIPISFPPKPKPPKILTTDILIIDDATEEDPVEILTDEIDETTAIEPFVFDFPEEIIEEENTPIIIPQVMPEFEGGIKGVMEYLQKNIVYPEFAKDANIQGKVYLTFVVEKDGSVSNVKLLKGIGGGCDEEAIRVVKKMPNWKPGKQFNKTVRVQYNLPIAFKLRRN